MLISDFFFFAEQKKLYRAVVGTKEKRKIEENCHAQFSCARNGIDKTFPYFCV